MMRKGIWGRWYVYRGVYTDGYHYVHESVKNRHDLGRPLYCINLRRKSDG